MKIAPTKIINENFFSILYTFVNLFLCFFMFTAHFPRAYLWNNRAKKKFSASFFSLLVKVRFISFRAIHSFILFCSVFFGVSHFYRPDLCDKNIKLSWYNLHFQYFQFANVLKSSLRQKLIIKNGKFIAWKKISWAH